MASDKELNKDIADSIKKITDAAIAELERTMSNTAKAMAQTMSDNCPVDTGQLKDSFSARTERTAKEINAYIDISAESEEGAWYAEFVEYGTGKKVQGGEGGRQTPWFWKPKPGSKYYQTDKKGNPVWIFTTGSKPQPFIRPAIAQHMEELEKGISMSLNLWRYHK